MRIRRRGYERGASCEIAGVVNISAPVLNAQGNIVAGLTVPYVKRIEGTVGITEIIASLRTATRRISEAVVASYHHEYFETTSRFY